MTATSGDIFDKIWRREAGSYELYRFDPGDGQGLTAILDVHPATPGTALILTEECVPSWVDLSPTRLQQVMVLGQLVARHHRDMLGVEDSAGLFFGDQVKHPHLIVAPKYARADVIDRMHPHSSRMREPIVHTALAEMQAHLEFPPELAEHADAELARISALATILPSQPAPTLYVS